jgi:YYY domain-containing protein
MRAKRKTKFKISKNFLKKIIKIEMIFLILFVLFTFLKTFSPDSDGGEAVMDFAFVNSINRGDELPSNYPWYAGEKLENVYYYFGHFLTSNLIKLSGVSPSMGYNLSMITFFTTFSIACYGLIYNLTGKHRFGVIAIIFLVFMGNIYGLLHIVNTIFPDIDIQTPSYEPATNGNLFQRLVKRGSSDLFWWSTRVIPWTITEVPWFSFLWGDLHAHYISYQFIAMFLVISLNFFLSKRTGLCIFGDTNLERFINILLIGICLGFMFPQFLWNYPLYLGLIGILIFFQQLLNEKKFTIMIFIRTFIILFLILIISVVSFLPSFISLLQPKAGGSIFPEHLKASVYHFFVILFLQWFLINSFFVSKFLKFDGFKNKKLRKLFFVEVGIYLIWLLVLLLNFFKSPERFFDSGLVFRFNLKYLLFDFQMIWIFIPMMVNSIILLLSKKITKKESFIVLLVFMGSVIFLGSELYSIHGRYVFFFKIFPSIWILWGIASVYSFYSLRKKINFNKLSNKVFSFLLFFIIFFSLFPYLIFGTLNITDNFRYSFGREYPSIDSLAFMKQVHKPDYQAIQWINKNIKGTPIIVEYIGYEYTYASRVSSFTGLPTLVGWRFHSSQLSGQNIRQREKDVHFIYNTTDNEKTLDLVQNYSIDYIFSGELERSHYPSEGLEKFSKYPEYYILVYNHSNVQIYEVNWENILRD